MDVSVHVVLGPDPGLHHPQQVHAARPQTRAAQVPEPERGAEQDMVMTIFTLFGDGPYYMVFTSFKPTVNCWIDFA